MDQQQPIALPHNLDGKQNIIQANEEPTVSGVEDEEEIQILNEKGELLITDQNNSKSTKENNEISADKAAEQTVMTRWRTEAGTIETASVQPHTFKATDMAKIRKP